jgi:hypothetical protein
MKARHWRHVGIAKYGLNAELADASRRETYGGQQNRYMSIIRRRVTGYGPGPETGKSDNDIDIGSSALDNRLA